MSIYNYIMSKKIGKHLHDSSFFYPFAHGLVAVCQFFRLKYRATKQYIYSLPRQYGYEDKRFAKIKSLRGAYSGKRCFIACTGPSLTIEDLESLKDEYVFGMNSICMIHDKTDWRPNFYGIQDVGVYERLKDTILNTDNGLVFAPYGYKRKRNTPDNWVYYHMCGSYHIFESTYLHKYFTKFSSDCYVKVYDGFSVTYSLLQIAIYMGFKEIYLIGADCSYLGEKKHFIEHGHNPANTDSAYDRLMVSYAKAKEYADSHNIKIYNATRGGCLELFPRVNLDEMLKK